MEEVDEQVRVEAGKSSLIEADEPAALGKDRVGDAWRSKHSPEALELGLVRGE